MNSEETLSPREMRNQMVYSLQVTLNKLNEYIAQQTVLGLCDECVRDLQDAADRLEEVILHVTSKGK